MSFDASVSIDHFQTFIENSEFPCVGAKSALRRDQTKFWSGRDLRDGLQDRDLLVALHDFIDWYKSDGAMFATFVAIFDGPVGLTEKEFERALWDRLEALHQLDAETYDWDKKVSQNPESNFFGFSLKSEACFVVGLHDGSSRAARRFERPTLVFNLHEQFKKLREEGRFEPLQDAIRKRDEELDGSINPMLADHGEDTEAKQYSGREVGDDWRCPFQPVGPVEREDAA